MDSAPDSQRHRPMPRRSRAWLAVSLTLLCPGWGHLYVGAVARGLLIALLNLAVIVPGLVWMWLAWAQGPATALVALGVTLALLIALPADAARCALREPRTSGRPSSAVRVVVLHGLFVPIAVTALRPHRGHDAPHRALVDPGEPRAALPDPHRVDGPHPAAGRLLPGGHAAGHARRSAPGRHHRVRAPPQARRRLCEARGGSRRRPRQHRGTGAGSRGGAAHGSGSLGDSRVHSRDSREFGPLSLEQVRGRVVRIFWSFDPIDRRVRWSRLGLGFAGMEG
jgi:hypothetical protein